MSVSNDDHSTKKKSRLVKSDNSTIEGQVAALYNMLCNVYGTDHLVLKASKVEALELLRSDSISDKVVGLKRIVNENPTYEIRPDQEKIPEFLDEIQDKIAEIAAKQYVEEELEQKIMEKMQQHQNEYFEEIKMQILKENSGPENAQTLKQLALLEKEECKTLTRSVLEVLRPKGIEEVIGQERGVQALVSKIASPFPQHILIYGPPGVGKTTAARLALEEAKKFGHTPFQEEAKFIEANGATLRWDPREVTNPLLGSVHDPIYQGAKQEFADKGTPEPKPGLVSEANGGVLFIDEIGEMDSLLLNKLIKVLEDKRVEYESSYYNPNDESIPQYIKKMFEQGSPADFILIGATTRDPSEINPAIRSRCAEIYFEPLTPVDIRTIILNAADKLEVKLDSEILEIISEYTIEGRKAISILADAYSLAVYKRHRNNKTEVKINTEDVYEVVRSSRLVPYTTYKAADEFEIGRIFGLGVSGFIGSVLEIEAVAFPAREAGKGKLRFNETAGSMTKDSVFNAGAVIRKVTGKELDDFDVHVNIVGGAKIDGPSAGAAILVAMISAITKKKVKQSVGITGEISIQGKIKPVGGIIEKIYGAKLAGMEMILVPSENKTDVPGDIKGIEVIPVSSVQEVIEYVTHSSKNKHAG